MNELIGAAYVAAMIEVQNPSRDAKANAGSYGYTYLTYDALSDYLRPILAKHGIAWTHPVENDDTHVRVSTLLVHTSGESWEFGPLTWAMPPKVQDFGGLLSYLKRYSLISTFGMGAGDDNDAAVVNSQDPLKSGSRAVRAEARATEKQIGYLTKLIREQHIPEPTLNDFALDRFGWELPRDGIAHLTAVHASDLIDALSKVRKAESAKVERTPPEDDPWQNATITDPVTGTEAL